MGHIGKKRGVRRYQYPICVLLDERVKRMLEDLILLWQMNPSDAVRKIIEERWQDIYGGRGR